MEIREIVGEFDASSPTHSTSEPGVHWTTTNLGEAMPGVQTPLSWTVWSRVTERAARQAAYRIGAFTRGERASPMLERDRFIRAFHGRAAFQLRYMTTVGDRMPGTSAAAIAENTFGWVPEDLVTAPTRRRYPVIALRLPAEFVAFPRRLRRFATDQDEWWRASVPAVAELDREDLTALLVEAVRRFDAAMLVQVIGIVTTMQPVYEALRQVVESAGAGDLSTLSGASGGAEMAVIEDIWSASRGRIAPAEVVARHGFHGPEEGELSSRVWREDDEPLRRIIAQYADRPDDADPGLHDARRRGERGAAERELLGAVPPARRPAVRLLLRFARERLPLRGVAKRSFLQALDVARASARRSGELLAAEGLLADPRDVFYLTATELAGGPSPDARELVSERRQRREADMKLELPLNWTGMPEARPAGAAQVAGREEGGLITGLGVSGGVAEGPARVVERPDFADVEPDEILVARTTDPSWSSIMFISSALVMDIGGALSHAAVVARELEIPCVVNTQSGTSAIRTGDRVRVDGDAGTVQVLG